MSTKLKTTADVIAALGGASEVAGLFGLTENAIGNWRTANAFPGYTFPTLTAELSRKALSAEVGLWNFGRKPHERRARNAEATP